jgi:hypothetical protein
MNTKTRTQKAISKTITSFGGSQANQWNTLAVLASEVSGFYWNKSRQSSLIVELDGWLQAPHSNKNMAKAYRAFIADVTPVLLKSDLTDAKHGASNAHKGKKMVSDFDAIATTIDGMIDGDTLKAYLNKEAKAPRAKATITTKTEALIKAIQADSLDATELQAAHGVLSLLQTTYNARLLVVEQEVGLSELVEPLAIAV